jgi:hypothetical protein
MPWACHRRDRLGLLLDHARVTACSGPLLCHARRSFDTHPNVYKGQVGDLESSSEAH